MLEGLLCGESLIFSVLFWETDFYTPQVLGGGAPFNKSSPAVYKLQGPFRAQDFHAPLALNCAKGSTTQH